VQVADGIAGDLAGIATHYEVSGFYATSRVRYLEGCIPVAEGWDVHLASSDGIREHILAFLATHGGRREI
jgi:hypothetical protein